MDFKQFIKAHFFYLILIMVALILFWTNYVPDTFLLGWDNMMPEFNPLMNLQRNLTGVWQTYRGLGLYDGMAHTANLVQTLSTGILSLFLPINMIRYASIILLHFIGGIGMLKLLERLKINKEISFLGALFYMFNLGTMQQFFAPLEAFSFHFAALPWLFWTAIGFLEQKSKSSLMLFLLVSFLSTPQSFVPTFFIVYVLGLSSLLIWDLINNKTIKYFSILLFITLAANSFWLIPYAYGIPQNAPVVQNARINQFSSENVYLRNKVRGGLMDVIKLKGFMMDVVEYDGKDNKNVRMMSVWEKYSSGIIFNLFWMVLTLITMLGIVKSFKNKKRVIFFVPLGIAFIALCTNTPILSNLNELIRNAFPIIAEVFRFPFTKFIILQAFTITIFLSIGLQHLTKFTKQRLFIILPILIIILYISLPAFQGNLFSSLVKRNLPVDYLQVFDYFQKQPTDKRIALLPAHTFWSWQYRQWGHVGSGFLWFGIQQPILERAFDPWSSYNEQSFNEISYAVKRNNLALFDSVLKKYNISYILLDQYLVNNLVPKPIDYNQLVSFLDSNSLLKKDFTAGKLIVYKSLDTLQNQQIITNPLKINEYARHYYQDPVFSQKSNYIIDQNDPDIIFPFANLFTEKLQSDREFEVDKDNNNLILRPKKNLFQSLLSMQTYRINRPDLTTSQLIPFKLMQNNNYVTAAIVYPEILTDGVKISDPDQSYNVALQTNMPIKDYYLTETDQHFSNNEIAYLFQDYPNTLRITYQNGQTELTKIEIGKFPKQSSINDLNIDAHTSLQIRIPISNIFAKNEIINNQSWKENNNQKEIVYFYDKLPYQTGYLVLIKSDWKSGLATSFYVDSPFTHRTELDTKIAKKTDYQNVFILPPNQIIGQGYGFHFSQESIGSTPAQTDIYTFATYPFPYEFISNITLQKQNTISNTDKYHVLFEAFNPGWKAYQIESKFLISNFQFLINYFPFLFGKQLKEHVMVNNWANGWKLSQSQFNQLESVGIGQKQNIVIVFWPQYLQFIGFGLLVAAFIIVIKYRHEKG